MWCFLFLNLFSLAAKDKGVTERGLLSALDVMKDPSSKYSQASGDEGMVLSNSSTFLNGDGLKTETPNVKKRHRRMKSSGVKNSEYDGMCPDLLIQFINVTGKVSFYLLI